VGEAREFPGHRGHYREAETALLTFLRRSGRSTKGLQTGAS
jgi:hypothetical protein